MKENKTKYQRTKKQQSKREATTKKRKKIVDKNMSKTNEEWNVDGAQNGNDIWKSQVEKRK